MVGCILLLYSKNSNNSGSVPGKIRKMSSMNLRKVVVFYGSHGEAFSASAP
jgi:hypothetical protein